MIFSKEEQQRYSRQMRLPEVGLIGQEKLRLAKILIIGAGGLGCPVLQYLVAAGVGTIGIVDHDLVELSNLQRQIIFATNDVGQLKVNVAKERMNLLNPNVKITTHTFKLTEENAEEIISNYDLVIDGSDNFATRYLVNDYCVLLNKPLVFGSILNFEGQISVFNYQDGPSYRDVFPEPATENIGNCAELGVLGVLPAIVGNYMANEALKIVLGIGKVLNGKLMVIDVLHNTTLYFNIAKTTVKIEEQNISKQESIYEFEINHIQLNKWLNEQPQQTLLIDVREDYEFEEFNIGGLNIPLDDLTSALPNLQNVDQVIFCCQSGERSKMAINLLKEKYKGAMYSLQGGIYG